MTNNFAETLFRHAIGYDPLLRLTDAVANVANFPPHNIIKLDDNHYRLTLAVAGFGKDDLSIEVHNGMLTVSGARRAPDEDGEFLYRGIAFRDFVRQFKIGENVVIRDATIKDGLLIVGLERVIPESERPKRIPIV